MQQHQQLLFWCEVRALNHDYVFELANTWDIEGQKFSYCLRHLLAVSTFPKHPERFRKAPTHHLDDHLRVHVVGLVRWRDVDSATLTAELVRGPEHPSDMNGIIPGHRVLVLVLLVPDIFNALIEIFARVQRA